MNALKTKIRQYPVAASFGVMIACVVFTRIFALFFSLLPDNVYINIVNEIVFILWPLAIAVICGYGWIYKRRGVRKALAAGAASFLPPALLLALAVFSAFFADNTQWVPGSEIIFRVLLLFGIGLREETLFRGVVVNLLGEKYLGRKHGLLITVGVSGVIFGMLHIFNVFSGVAFSNALFQALATSFTGFLYCAIYLRSGSLWGVALIHSTLDAAGLFEAFFLVGGSIDAVFSSIDASALALGIPQLLLTLFLLRKSKRGEILARYQDASAKA
ncbi:MAG: CPBP family intramembrane metalloprotease [Eubacteriales bacterium]|nr:CPBP family intramembrane metalloprotease [Eubacteriales bacterium]